MKKLNLQDLVNERQELPGRIADAAIAGDVKLLTDLRKRQTEIESEIFAGEVASRRAEIESLEAQRLEAAERASHAASRCSAQVPALIEELAAAKARVVKIPSEIQSLHGAADRAQREVALIAGKIEQARDDLAAYIEKTSKPPAQAAA
jgi:predicted  nucleic acid-binding Zn-ribbon protein